MGGAVLVSLPTWQSDLLTMGPGEGQKWCWLGAWVRQGRPGSLATAPGAPAGNTASLCPPGARVLAAQDRMELVPGT